MSGIAMGAHGAPGSDWFDVLLGSGSEQVGYLKGDTNPGAVSVDHWKGIEIRTIIVSNDSIPNRDAILLNFLDGSLPQNFFKAMHLRDLDNKIIVFNSSDVVAGGFANFPSSSPAFTAWVWNRTYHTTWPESIRGQTRKVRFT